MNTANRPELVYIYREVVDRDTYKFRKLAALYPDIKTIVDIGASFGPATKFMKTLWPNAVVYAFEPDADRFKLLKENLAEFSSVECHNVGVYGKNLQHVGFDGYRWRKSPEEAWQTATCSVENCAKIDISPVLNIWPENVDLLKIDVEGFEWGIIEDLAVARKLPRIIVGEWHFNNALAGLIQLLEPTHKFEFLRPDTNPWGLFTAIKKNDPAPLAEDVLASVSAVLPPLWRPDDHFKCAETTLRHYATKATICQQFNPRKILEIGTRCGYSVIAFSIVAPSATFTCIDSGVDPDSPQNLAHAKQNFAKQKIDANIFVVNSRDVRNVHSFDFAHVDGEHTYEGALADLNLVAEVPAILVDDCCELNVFRAVQEFVANTNRNVKYFYDGLRDIALIT